MNSQTQRMPKASPSHPEGEFHLVTKNPIPTVPRKNDPIDKYELRIPTRRLVGVTIATLVMNTPHVELARIRSVPAPSNKSMAADAGRTPSK
jgi:hypothetical protein